MKLFAQLLPLAVLCALCGCSEDTSAGKRGEVILTVIDGESLRPLSGVKVKASSARTRYRVGAAADTDNIGRTALPYEVHGYGDFQAQGFNIPEGIIVSLEKDGYIAETVLISWDNLEGEGQAVKIAKMFRTGTDFRKNKKQ
ncbi:MAG: hypothetical protein JXR97_05075 [Planctomycetes bacterium]|nr:hypothetical protein [Planctomycetota bacterium]